MKFMNNFITSGRESLPVGGDDGRECEGVKSLVVVWSEVVVC